MDSYTIPKKKGSKIVAPLVRPIIPLQRPEATEKIPPSEYIEHKCHNDPGDAKSGQYVVKIPRYGSGTPEDWLMFIDLCKKAIIGQNVTTGPPMYAFMDRVLKGDAKAEFTVKANAEGTKTVEHFEIVMNKMTAHVFPTYAYRDQKRYLTRYLRKPPGMTVKAFTTRLVQLNEYLTYFPPDTAHQAVAKLPLDDVKEILYHAMPNSWKKEMTKQGYNYISYSLDKICEFFKNRCEDLEEEAATEKKKKKKGGKKKKVRISEASDSSSAESETEAPSKKKHCILHGWCTHTTNACNDLKELIRKSKKKKQKGFAKKAGKSYNKQELNAFFEKKLKKALKVGKEAKRTHELRNFESMNLSDSEKSSAESSVSSSSSDSS
jgi:hypothetical protein